MVTVSVYNAVLPIPSSTGDPARARTNAGAHCSELRSIPKVYQSIIDPKAAEGVGRWARSAAGWERSLEPGPDDSRGHARGLHGVANAVYGPTGAAAARPSRSGSAHASEIPGEVRHVAWGAQCFSVPRLPLQAARTALQ